MLIQISSGQGPVECSVGVEKLCKALLKEFSGARVVSVNEDYSGHGYKSCVMEFDQDISSLEGTVLWVWKSTIRTGHQRKNWYMDVSVIKEAESVGEFDLTDIFEYTVDMLEDDAAFPDQGAYILRADIGQQDQNQNLQDIHHKLDHVAAFAVDQVDDNIHTQMRVLPVRIGAAHKDGPDEET